MEAPGDSTSARIGAALSAVRRRRGLTQSEVARQLGLKSAQIISNIESGQRELKAVEAHRLSKILNVSFADLVSGEAPQEPYVLWRDGSPTNAATKAQRKEEAVFVERCRRYAFVEKVTGSRLKSSLPEFRLDLMRASFEDMNGWAETVCRAFDLGGTPATQLRSALEERAGVKVFLDDLHGGSGAATRGDFGNAILENRAEPPTRRAFSLAHELFHLLTWDAVAHRAAELSEPQQERNEKLANAFASALLLPRAEIERRFEGQELEDPSWARLLPAAAAFAVSPPALVWRLRNLGRLSEAATDRLLAARRDRDSRRELDNEPALPSRFVLLAYQAWVDGKISIGKLAEMLETSVGLLPGTLSEYGIDMERDAEKASSLPA